MKHTTAAVFLFLMGLCVSCSGLMAAAEEGGKGATVGGAAAGGALFGPLGAFVGAILAFFGIRIAEGNEAVTAAAETLQDPASALSLWDQMALFLGQWGLGLAVLLLVLYVLWRQKVGERFYNKMNKLEKATGIDLDNDGDVGLNEGEEKKLAG